MSIYYRTFGDPHNSALLMLHSGGMNGEEWKAQIPELSKDNFLVIPDLPAHSRSLENSPLSLDLMANKIMDLVNSLELQQFSILGSSLGAAVAMKIALENPSRIKKAIFYRMSYHLGEAALKETAKISSAEYWQSYGLEKIMSNWHLAQGDVNSWKTVIKNVALIIKEHNYCPKDFKNLHFPVLLIAGDKDPIAPLDELLEIYKFLKNGHLWIIPNADHITATNTWRAQSFNKEITRFLNLVSV